MVLFEDPDCKIRVALPNPLICLIAGHSILRGNKQYEATNTKNGPNAAGCRLRLTAVRNRYSQGSRQYLTDRHTYTQLVQPDRDGLRHRRYVRKYGQQC